MLQTLAQGQVDNSKLPVIRRHFYEELGCTPATSGFGFNCPNFEETYQEDKCYFQKYIFPVNSIASSSDLREYCFPECRCLKVGSSRAALNCAHNDCPENRGLLRPEPGCILTKSPGKCCSTGVACGEELEQLHQCHFQENYYFEGETMQPNGSCHTCRCNSNFDPAIPYKHNPNCKRIGCPYIWLRHLEKIVRGCAPMFNENDCCPTYFHCRKFVYYL